MIKKKIITKISKGLGNQLFMYANSYALSEKFDLDFYIDPLSGYYKKKEVYHFCSVTTRKRKIIKNNGTKTFLLKWGFNPRFFRKYYLKGVGNIEYSGPVNNYKVGLNMMLDLLINKLKFFYHKVLS